ncbi:hypothetical protein [Georgenia thermotolerans]|uniref:DUF4386 family protein n=1 Tax=Georgenia thermotolerans TaxID=527326 RepID=A0A7J5UPV2_9MICO|nr:hypothetical protein [Georgenia thermotolerans]KAE8764250.1 hypothetical protein GB883_09910 [Georgenia thermotolerans]
MKTYARFYRSVVAVSLALCAILTTVSVLLMPPFEGGYVQHLQAVADAGASATVSALAFTLSQLPFIIGLVGVAHLARRGAPVLAGLGGALAVLGGFGHAVYGGVSTVILVMAADPANYEAHAAVLAAGEGGVQVPFLLLGLAGTVLGTILIAVGLLRAKVGPAWLPWVLIGFVLVEFVGTNFSDWATVASGVLFLLGFLTLAAVVTRSDVREWSAAADEIPAPVGAAMVRP